MNCARQHSGSLKLGPALRAELAFLHPDTIIHTVLSGPRKIEVDGPSLHLSYISRLKPILFLVFDPPSSYVYRMKTALQNHKL